MVEYQLTLNLIQGWITSLNRLANMHLELRKDEMEMIKVKCPCCRNYTHEVETDDEPLFEICDVCWWQYDAVAHEKPDTMLGANSVTLNQARKNYKLFGVIEERFIGTGREPKLDELPENNS